MNEIEEIKIENLIYEIREKQVMVDSDLAKLYGCKNGTKEIDFVCDKDGKRIYIQVCYYLSSEKNEEREFGAYENIKDNYPKYVLSMDEFDMSRNGIIHMNIRDFLLNFKNS